MSNPICPYCNAEAKLVTGSFLYPHRPDLADLKFWHCDPCGSCAGTHANSPDHAPKAGLALAPLRQARMRAHAVFDPIWQEGRMSRGAAYRWLKEKLGMDEQPHIGFMNEEQCARVIAACRE